MGARECASTGLASTSGSRTETVTSDPGSDECRRRHRHPCLARGSLPRRKETLSRTLERPPHTQPVPGPLHHPQPRFPALPRTHRQTRHLIKPHHKMENYLDIYPETPPSVERSGGPADRLERFVRYRPIHTRARSASQSSALW
jgi:hypothetical protein